MISYCCRMFLLVAVIMLTATLVAAQTTGEIKGTVKDDNQEALPGVLITVSGPALKGERVVRSDAQGRYQFPVLPPGVYTLKFLMDSYQVLEMSDIAVKLGGTTHLPVQMQKGDVETVVVLAPPPPLIDTRSVDAVLNLGSGVLDKLPTGARDFRDVTKYVPSVTGVDVDVTTGRTAGALGLIAGGGFPSIRGEGQYGDNYMIDGLSVRDPAFKSTATPLPYDVIEEVQIITDGFSPEYGQALGGLVNVITKNGSNNLDGEVAYLYSSDSLGADFDETFLGNVDSYDNSTPYINLGGPLVKDKLWFFTSYNREDRDLGYEGADFLGVESGGDQEVESDTFFGKVSWAISTNHDLSVSYTYQDAEAIGLDVERATTDAVFNQEDTQTRLRLNYQAILSPHSVLELRLGKLDTESELLPISSIDPAQYLIADNGLVFNNTFLLEHLENDRQDYGLYYTEYWNSGGRFGSHEFKGGVEFHKPEQRRQDQFTGKGEDVFSISPPGAPDAGMPDRFNSGARFNLTQNMGNLVPTVLNEYVPGVLVPNRNEEWSIFVQDRWEIGNFNILLGLRADRAKAFNNEDKVFFDYEFSDALAHRLSVAWDVNGNAKNVFKAGWGRFHDTASTRFGEFANTAFSFSFRNYRWTGANNDDFRNHIGDMGPIDIHNPANWAFNYEQSQEATPSTFDQVTRPARVDRLLLEYNRALGHQYALKVRYVNSHARDLIDDVHDPFPVFTFQNTNLKRRNYYSYELEFSGRPTPNVSFDFSYVKSRSRGTNQGQFERAGFLSEVGNGNNIGTFLDRPPSRPAYWCKFFAPDCVDPSLIGDPTFDLNGDDTVDQYDYDLFIQNIFGGLGSIDGNLDGWYGDLAYSIDDQVKLRGRFNIPQWGDMYVSGFLQWYSGYHTERLGFNQAFGFFLTHKSVPILTTVCADPMNPTFATCAPTTTKTPVYDRNGKQLNFSAEDGQHRGAIELDPYWTLDLYVGKVWNLTDKVGLDLRAELFNIFDQQEPLTISRTAASTFGEPLTRQLPRTVRLFARLSY